MPERPLAAYYAAVSAALRADDTEAIPGLLIVMAVDGYGHEAEELRRELLLAAKVEPEKWGVDEVRP